MPSPSYAQNKKSIYNWRAKNPEKYKEQNRLTVKKCRQRQKDYKIEALIFRMILFIEI